MNECCEAVKEYTIKDALTEQGKMVTELSKKISEVASIIGADVPNPMDDVPVLNMSEHIRANNVILEECLVMMNSIREKLG